MTRGISKTARAAGYADGATMPLATSVHTILASRFRREH